VPALGPATAQQPPLHGCVPLHDAVHLPAVTSHALFAGQSLVLLQPQAPLARQAEPFGSPLQLTHALPTGPHAVGAMPRWQVPLAPQQPERHGIAAEQLVTHRFALQPVALPMQSVRLVQPH
jgi:hypothetical protein